MNYKKYILLNVVMFSNVFTMLNNHNTIVEYYDKSGYDNFFSFVNKKFLFSKILLYVHVFNIVKSADKVFNKNDSLILPKLLLMATPIIAGLIIRKIVARKNAYSFIYNNVNKNDTVIALMGDNKKANAKSEEQRNFLFNKKFLAIKQWEDDYFFHHFLKIAKISNLIACLFCPKYTLYGYLLVNPVIYNISLATKTYYDYCIYFYSKVLDKAIEN